MLYVIVIEPSVESSEENRSSESAVEKSKILSSETTNEINVDDSQEESNRVRRQTNEKKPTGKTNIIYYHFLDDSLFIKIDKIAYNSRLQTTKLEKESTSPE